MMFLISGSFRTLREMHLALSMISLREQEQIHELENRLDLFSHPGCAIYLNDLEHVTL